MGCVPSRRRPSNNGSSSTSGSSSMDFRPPLHSLTFNTRSQIVALMAYLLPREGHVKIKDEAKIASRCAGMISSPRDEFVKSENLSRRNSDESSSDEEVIRHVGGDANDFIPIVPKPRNMAFNDPDTSKLDASEFKQEVLIDTGQLGPSMVKGKKVSVSTLLRKREQGTLKKTSFSVADCRSICSNYLPNKKETVAHFNKKIFCGTYSQCGNVFLSACQDGKIRVFDTSLGQFRLINRINALDMGWSVLDTAFSSNGYHLVYSSWSDYLHICNLRSESINQKVLHLNPDSERSFCIFSVVFSQDNRELLGGSNDRCLYVYDLERNERTLKINAHDDDVNAVVFADDSSHILFSGSDDGLCKVWDRRTLSESDPQPVGVLAGHLDGITFIDSKGDGRYLISNSKDQSIKLWDMRWLSSEDAQNETKLAVARQNWDYRWQKVPKPVKFPRKYIKGDTSLMTYRGHTILSTLIRSRFSPVFTTGQKYIYTGCASGNVIVYDVLTGQIVHRLVGHKSCVRDVSWHPFENNIVTTSWDCTIARWSYDGSGSRKDGDPCSRQSSKNGR